MERISIDYKHFNKGGFDSKSCGLWFFQEPNPNTYTRAESPETSAGSRLISNEYNASHVVTFNLEYVPYITGKNLMVKAYELVQEVLTDKFKPEPFTYCKHKKDGALDGTATINDVFIQAVKIDFNPKDDSNNAKGHMSIQFTLQGVFSTPFKQK